MFKWRTRKRENEAEQARIDESQLRQTIEHLTISLQRLEHEIARLNERSIHVTIENIYAEHPVLENLTFKLDSLDIEELSGSLNLGNNWGVNPKRERKQEQEHKAGAKPEHEQESKPKNMEKTTHGFKIKLGS